MYSVTAQTSTPPLLPIPSRVGSPRRARKGSSTRPRPRPRRSAAPAPALAPAAASASALAPCDRVRLAAHLSSTNTPSGAAPRTKCCHRRCCHHQAHACPQTRVRHVRACRLDDADLVGHVQGVVVSGQAHVRLLLAVGTAFRGIDTKGGGGSSHQDRHTSRSACHARALGMRDSRNLCRPSGAARRRPAGTPVPNYSSPRVPPWCLTG